MEEIRIAVLFQNYFYLELLTKRLAGKWITRSGHIWTCSEFSFTQLSCNGNKVTINGGKIVWDNTNEIGTINHFNEIAWESGNFWKREGIVNKER